MPLVRIIRKARWYEESAPWLPQDDIQADPIADLETVGNSLSLDHVAEDETNLNQIAAALAAKRENIVNLDYLIFDIELLKDIGLSPVITSGETPDNQVNQEWHRDIERLSAGKLFQLARLFYQFGSKKRLTEKEVFRILCKAFAVGVLDRTSVRLKESEIQKIQRSLNSGQLTDIPST